MNYREKTMHLYTTTSKKQLEERRMQRLLNLINEIKMVEAHGRL